MVTFLLRLAVDAPYAILANYGGDRQSMGIDKGPPGISRV
ncbi:hypothetical protein SPLC1_S204030 [Arthrospira platensis C1]|nr:hypothetical protein SPLC1_S204030 [Arthrospira platensis C1]